MPKVAQDHKRLEIDTPILLCTGLGGAGRCYPDYYAKFGEEKVKVLCWDKNCTDLKSHLDFIRANIPENQSFVAVGHSMGGSLLLELLARERIPNLEGLVLVGASRRMRSDQGLNFIMKFPWFFLWIFSILITLAFPITILFWRSKTYDTYRELWRFLTKDGAQKIHKQYNLTLRKLGTIKRILNPEVPLVIVRLKEDTLIDKKDLAYTKTMFHNVHEQIIKSNSLHLTEKFDPITVEKIALEAKFLRLITEKTQEKEGEYYSLSIKEGFTKRKPSTVVEIEEIS
ncbi:MAG: hypothetical protein GF308_03595 [Candidatus Heimdallarchaeota archaeon]|nr:hypothetical protein [Candidatus Heimdallarchaeota archaeon]